MTDTRVYSIRQRPAWAALLKEATRMPLRIFEECWWVFPVIGFGLMFLFVLMVLRPIALGVSKTLLGTGDADVEVTPRSPAEILRERYARGEITREGYREALVDMLKDHYVRGEITLEEFEVRLEMLLSTEGPQSDAEGGFGTVSQGLG